MIARTDPPKAKSASPGKDQALFTTDTINVNAQKEISTARAKLAIAGGQVLHEAEGGAFFVTTPFMHVTKFDDLQALQAYIKRVAA